MRPAGDLAEHRVLRIGAQHAVGGLGPRTQQPPRGAIGEGRLADALRPDQQPGVVQSATLQRVQERLLRAFQALQAGGVAGMDQLAHGASRASTAAQIAAST